VKSVRALVPLVWLATACRIGGPSADPNTIVEFPNDAADAADARDEIPMTVEAGGDDASTDHQTPDDASSGRDATGDGGAAGDGPTGESGEAAAACTPPASVPVCNPLTNTGCFLVQCDVDTTMTSPTGICVLAAPVLGSEGAACTQTAGSTTCQPQLTCFGGTCRKVCFCNADCTGGECCSAGIGTTGFKQCDTCP
jgi:hypothetical protein